MLSAEIIAFGLLGLLYVTALTDEISLNRIGVIPSPAYQPRLTYSRIRVKLRYCWRAFSLWRCLPCIWPSRGAWFERTGTLLCCARVRCSSVAGTSSFTFSRVAELLVASTPGAMLSLKSVERPREKHIAMFKNSSTASSTLRCPALLRPGTLLSHGLTSLRWLARRALHLRTSQISQKRCVLYSQRAVQSAMRCAMMQPLSHCISARKLLLWCAMLVTSVPGAPKSPCQICSVVIHTFDAHSVLQAREHLQHDPLLPLCMG
jgi:hypothetical protein